MLSNIDKGRMINSLSECLKAIGFPPPGPIGEKVRMWFRNGILVCILEPGVSAFNDSISLIEKRGRVDGRAISDVFSREYIEAKIEELIGQLVIMAVESDRQPSELNKDQIRETLNEWLSDFQVPSELATYYTVIGNLVVQAPIKVGTVTLSPLNEESRDAMLNEFNRAIDGSIDPQESKEQFKQFIVTNLSVDQKRVIASAEINEAESHRAWEIFQERIREVLHALRFFGSFVYPRRHHAMIDFAGYVYCGRNVFLRLVAGKQAGLNLQNTGYLLPYELVGERLQHLENVGLHIVGDILSKQQGERTPLERSCINAITWISRALEDDVADSRFLKLCIALESILLRRDDQPYRQIMAERVAFILGQDLDGRLIVARDIKKIYDIRSSIVHEGHSEGLEEWLGKTEFYATRTVLRFIQLMREKGWDSENAFIDWLDSLKFA